MSDSVRLLLNGQFGNYVQSISNAIYYCMENDLCLHVDTSTLDAVPMISDITYPGKPSTIVDGFYNITTDGLEYTNDNKTKWKLKNYEQFVRTKKEICKKYISPNILKQDVDDIPEDALVIHFRGGDIWCSPFGVHPEYSQFPYSYIKKVSDKYEKIVIVYQDMTNQILQKFISDISETSIDLKLVSSSLPHDVNYLMKATNLMQTGIGTFLPSIALLSDKVKNYYSCDNTIPEQIGYKFLEPHVNVHVTKLEKYIVFNNRDGNPAWNASPDQVKALMDY